MVQILELQDKVNSLNDLKECYDPETASSSGLFFVPSQPMSIPSPRGVISRESCLQSDTRKSLGTSGHVFEGLPAPREPSSALFAYSKNWASSSCGLRPTDTGKNALQREGVRKEPQDFTRPTPRFARNVAGGTYSQNCMVESPRNQISQLHFGKFPDSSDFQCWKVNFKTEVCSISGYPTIAMLWTKEEEIAKSVDDLMTSQSIEGRDFPDFKMLDAKIASAFKKNISLTSSSDEEFVSKSRPHKNTTEFHEDGRVLKSMTIFEQSALMMQLLICQIFSMFPYKETTFKISIHGGIELHLTASEIPNVYILESFVQVAKYEILFSFKQYWLCTTKKLIEIEQCQAITDCRPWSEDTLIKWSGRATSEPGVTGLRQEHCTKGAKSVLKGEWKQCYQWKTTGQCSRGDSCSFQPRK